MIRENVQQILKYVSGERAFQTVAEISTYHRIQCSTGYRAAAEHVKQKLDRMGIPSAEVLSFPSSEKGFWGPYPTFQEWDITNAWCDLVSPCETRLADFDACPISVIQKSIAVDLRNTPTPVIMLDKGSKEAAYRNLDLQGKIVFYRGDFNEIYGWAVEKKGAIGILTDYVLEDPYVRERHDQSDTRRYTSFWWKPDQKKAFGFVLTPRQGDKLAKLCAELAAKKEYPTVTCYVDSRLYDGHIEDVTAFLPGETDEEILLVGHLCHPRASANDNASGCAAVMEAMRTINDLVNTGKLPPLKRGIRMLLVPEFPGSYAYVEKLGAASAKIKAAFNLDMVGGRQDRGYGPITITDLPLSLPSLVSDAAAVVLDEIRHEVSGMTGSSFCPMFNSHITSFSGGSDHIVYSDPQCSIPCLMLGQWPDKYYHTSSDTLDRVDPYILSRSAALAAGYAYSLANLEAADMAPICDMGLARTAAYLSELYTLLGKGKVDPAFYNGRIAAYTNWKLQSFDSFYDWIGDICPEELEAQKNRIRALVKAIEGFDPTTARLKSIITPAQKVKYRMVIRRTCNTPFPIRGPRTVFEQPLQAMVEEFQEKYVHSMGDALTAIGYYFDGVKTVAQVAMDLAYEFNVYDPAAVLLYAKILVAAGQAEEV
ncbi:MAG: DUF4910 domain-containing protein [Firmicutes bacterium]|nr:DUF4910 domain-containing protein [Bacillota bacterium]